jgi:hypothetical protein
VSVRRTLRPLHISLSVTYRYVSYVLHSRTDTIAHISYFICHSSLSVGLLLAWQFHFLTFDIRHVLHRALYKWDQKNNRTSYAGMYFIGFSYDI